MAQPVIHWEITGKDGEALKQFYGQLFGWEFDSDNPQNYGFVAPATEGGPTGAVASAQQGPGMLTFYVASEDITKDLEQAVDLGGAVVMPETELDQVTIGLFSDPNGNVVGLAKM